MLEDFNAHIANNSVTWKGVIGRNGLRNRNLSGALLVDFCANHSLPITNTMFEHKGNQAPEHDSFCNHILGFVFVCYGHLGEERS